MWRKRVIWCMDRLHKIHLLNERPPWWIHMVWEETSRKKQVNSRPDNVWQDLWTHTCDAAKKKAKQRWAIEKPKLDNARIISLRKDEFYDSLQSCLQVHSDASSNENSGCNGSSGKIMSKIGENSCMAADESQKQEKGDGWSRDKGSKIDFTSLMDLCHLKTSELELRWGDIPNDSRKSHGHHIQTSRMFRSSYWCSIRFYEGEHGRCTNVIENVHSQNAQRCGYVYESTRGPKSWSSVEDPVVVLERMCTVTSGRTIVGKAFWESSIETTVDEKLNWECSFVNRAKGLFISVCLDDKMAGKTENVKPTWKTLKGRWSGRMYRK